jgi:hypothetical protein
MKHRIARWGLLVVLPFAGFGACSGGVGTLGSVVGEDAGNAGFDGATVGNDPAISADLTDNESGIAVLDAGGAQEMATEPQGSPGGTQSAATMAGAPTAVAAPTPPDGSPGPSENVAAPAGDGGGGGGDGDVLGRGHGRGTRDAGRGEAPLGALGDP